MSSAPSTRLDRMKRPFHSPRGHYVERYTSPHTHPGGSIWRTTLQKLRVPLAFAARRLTLGTGRHRALSKLRSLAGAGRGREVLVIGSGPSASSLRPQEVKKRQLAGDLLVVATNYFLDSPLAKTITPDYLVWADHVFNPASPEHSAAQWDKLDSTHGVTAIVPWTWRRHITVPSLESRTLFFDNDSLEGWSRNISPVRPRGYQGNTGVKALAVALHLEPKTVLVVGIDLSYYRNFAVDAENRILRQPTHITGADSGTQEIGQHSVHGLADALYSTASQFLALHTHFAGRPIINLDAHSLIDAFPKVTEHPLIKKSAAHARRVSA